MLDTLEKQKKNPTKPDQPHHIKQALIFFLLKHSFILLTYKQTLVSVAILKEIK